MKPRVAIVGVGVSRLFRRDDVALGVLSVEAIQAALDDAGLRASDLDGVSSTPNQPFHGAGDVDGLNIVSPELVRDAMHLDLAWSERTLRSTGPSLISAINAVASGQCRYAVALRAMHSPSGRRYGHTRPTTAVGPDQFRGPYGVFPPSQFGRWAMAHMARYGSTREQLGAYAIRSRANALRQGFGHWFQAGAAPLTMDEYLGARMISTPLGMFDCDIPVQVAGAFIVTTVERAKDLRQAPAYVLGTAYPNSITFNLNMSLDQYLDTGRSLARHLWRISGVTPNDLSIANLYDGFSIEAPLWAEALSLCGPGEGFAYVAASPLPINLWGGSLGTGRLHGIGQIVDAVRQIQGRAGPQQVQGADVCLAVTNACDLGAVLVLSRTGG